MQLLVISPLLYSQHSEQCGTMQNFEELKLSNPSIDSIRKALEDYTYNWGENDSIVQNQINYSTNNQIKIHSKSLCSYNNVLYATIASPTILNQIVYAPSNCVYGGEYVRVTNLIAGRTYRISTCGVNNFDTQLTIWTAGGGYTVAHNDDWCGPTGAQSEIYFTPLITGDYDILVDQFNCSNSSSCANLEIELFYIPGASIVIPVVVHVIHDGEPIGMGKNLSVAQIQSQIDVLNEDFRRLNADIYSIPSPFRGASMDTRIQFCLAVRDPAGNPTSGITRQIGSQSSYSMAAANSILKPSTIWNRNSYLNLWTVEFGAPNASLLGFAEFPGAAANVDGVVIRYTAFGNTGNVIPPYHLGRTTTHEVGHWLNLNHIWGDEPACGMDDNVSDTPWQGDNSIGCPSFPITTDVCSPNYPGPMYTNYMDYTDDNCMGMFTYGQFYRMYATLFGARVSLQSSLGCVSGTTTTANFYANVTSGVAPLSVNFTDQSSNSPTAWAWTFYGGAVPPTSSLQNPSGVTWNTTGLKTVKLVATNAWGSDTENKVSYINVVSGAGIDEQDFYFQIYPNPSTGLVNISCSIDKPNAKLELLNMIGQTIISMNISLLSCENYSLDISEIANGIYILSIDGNQSRIIKE